MSSNQPRASSSPNKKRTNANQDAAQQRSGGGTPSSTNKRRLNQTPMAASRNERSLSQPPPTSIIRKQLRTIGVDLDSQPTSSTPAALNRNRNPALAPPTINNNNNSIPTPRSIRKTPSGTTPRRNPTNAERSQLLTSEKKRRSEEESMIWTERKRRRSRFGAGGVTPKGNASGLGGWAGGRDESPLELLRRLARGKYAKEKEGDG